jgi:hypothetical protein
VPVADASANPTLGCKPLIGFPGGAIALVDRGACSFVQKATNAQAAGASAVIVVNNVPGDPSTLSGSGPAITIPVVHVSQATATPSRPASPRPAGVSHDPH